MPANKGAQYHAILDLLDRNQYDAAAERMYDWTSDNGKAKLLDGRSKIPNVVITRQEFKLLLNAFILRKQSVRTA